MHSTEEALLDLSKETEEQKSVLLYLHQLNEM
jgi:hypothetical protein